MEQNNRITTSLGMSLNKKYGKIHIYHNTIQALAEPKHVRFLFNPEAKKLAVQATKRKQAECFKVPQYIPDKWEFRLSSTPMINMVWKCCGWDMEKTYRLTGELHEEYGLVEFLETGTLFLRFFEGNVFRCDLVRFFGKIVVPTLTISVFHHQM